jgi:acetaldehyde dehydrogenase (acetylating)
MGIIIEGSDYKTMHRNLIQQVEEEDVMGVPVCGGNLTSPVVDTVNYIGEVHYKIGTRLYIENAD